MYPNFNRTDLYVENTEFRIRSIQFQVQQLRYVSVRGAISQTLDAFQLLKAFGIIQ